MKQDEFLQQLADTLESLSDSERSEVLNYYREMICDGMENGEDEEALIAGFGSIDDIASQILAESRSPVPAPRTAQGGGKNPYAARDLVHTIIIDAQNVRLEARPTAGRSVQVYFTPSELDDVNCTEENGVFTFTHRMPFHFGLSLGLRGLFAGPRVILVDIPADFNGELRLSTRNAGLSAAGLTALDRARFSTSNARLALDGVTCGTLEAVTSNASLHFHNLRGTVCDAHTSNASAAAEDCVFTESLHLKTSNGSIHLNDAGADHMEFTSSNGSIRGTVRGDMRQYAVYSHTSNGSNSLPAEMAYPDQTKSIRVSTSNARIDVKFVAE